MGLFEKFRRITQTDQNTLPIGVPDVDDTMEEIMGIVNEAHDNAEAVRRLYESTQKQAADRIEAAAASLAHRLRNSTVEVR